MKNEIKIAPEERAQWRARLTSEFSCHDADHAALTLTLLDALDSAEASVERHIASHKKTLVHCKFEFDRAEQAEARAVELETYISKLVYELTDGKLSKPYDVQVVADEVSQIWQEYTDTKVAEAREEEAARQAVEMEQIDFEEVH